MTDPIDPNLPANSDPRYDRGLALSLAGFAFIGLIDLILIFTAVSFAGGVPSDADGIGMSFMVFGFPVVVVSGLIAAVLIGKGRGMMRERGTPPRWQTFVLVPHLLLLAFVAVIVQT